VAVQPAVSTKAGDDDPSQVDDDGSTHFSRLVAPFLAGFTLPPIVLLASGSTPAQPWRDLALSLFLVATALLLSGFLLSVGSLYRDALRPWGAIRFGLTFAGLLSFTAALAVVVVAGTGPGLPDAAVAVLALAVLLPMALRIGKSVRPAWGIWASLRLPPRADARGGASDVDTLRPR
jgi:hypothetical protein